MSVYDERRDELESQEFMMGTERGRLAVTLDLLTDALVLVGQHGVYCQSARQPGKPAMDIQMISKCLTDAKELVADVMGKLKSKTAEERSGADLFAGLDPDEGPHDDQPEEAQQEHQQAAAESRRVSGKFATRFRLIRCYGGLVVRIHTGALV